MELISKRPVTLAEAKELAGNTENNSNLHNYFKAFVKLSKKDADALTQSLAALNNIKLKDEDFVKLVDFSPQTSEDVQKILSHVSVSEEEVNSILSVVKKY